MSIVVRDVHVHELDSVLALNNDAGPTILSLDAARLQLYFDRAEYFRIALRDGNLAGLLIGFGSGSMHDSRNFAWFRDRFPGFFYIDRVVVASPQRGSGIGRALYADVQSHAELRYPQLACEIALQRANDPALLFHGSFGFREIGQDMLPARPGRPARRVAMLMKELCSYPWVNATYGAQLPALPWLRARAPRRHVPQRATGT